ncbi:MAG: hypothetical protein P8X98_07680 [Woeseiaceae bacterium]|jgi:hypothetical protein
MNWDAIGAIAEAIGALAVVVSIVYLAVQIQSGARALRTTLRDSAFHDMQEWNYVLSSDEELPWIFKRGLSNPKDLNDKELARFHHMLYSFYKVFENIYLHFLDGSIAKEAWENNNEILFLYYAEKGAHEYWRNRREIFDPRFRALVESSQGSSMTPSDRLFEALE